MSVLGCGLLRGAVVDVWRVMFDVWRGEEFVLF